MSRYNYKTASDFVFSPTNILQTSTDSKSLFRQRVGGSGKGVITQIVNLDTPADRINLVKNEIKNKELRIRDWLRKIFGNDYNIILKILDFESRKAQDIYLLAQNDRKENSIKKDLQETFNRYKTANDNMLLLINSNNNNSLENKIRENITNNEKEMRLLQKDINLIQKKDNNSVKLAEKKYYRIRDVFHALSEFFRRQEESLINNYNDIANIVKTIIEYVISYYKENYNKKEIEYKEDVKNEILSLQNQINQIEKELIGLKSLLAQVGDNQAVIDKMLQIAAEILSLEEKKKDLIETTFPQTDEGKEIQKQVDYYNKYFINL